MIIKELNQFIRSCVRFQLVNSYFNEAHNMLHTIEPDTSISRLLGTRGHPRPVYILKDYNMPGMYDSIWDRSSQWTEANYTIPGCTMGFWKKICSFWSSKTIFVMYADGPVAVIFKETFQETLLIPIHAVERGNQKVVINEGFHL